MRAQLSGPRLRARVGTRSSYNFYQRKQKFFLADREKLWFVIRGGKVSRMQYWWNDLRARNPFQQRLSLIVRMNGGRSEASQHSEKPDAKNFLKKRALGQNWALGQTESFRNRSKETHCLVDFFLPWIWRPATFRRWQIMGSGYCPAVRPLRLYLQIKSGWWSFLFSSPFQLYHILQTSVLNQVPNDLHPVGAKNWCIKVAYVSIWYNCCHLKLYLQLGSYRFFKGSLKLKTLVSLRFKMPHLKKWIIEMSN